ncbi:histidine kinase N-terminal 7TM domain-containing protein [Halobacterium yunchengense]|uniref:histidine kinase N-terminal 7TM domain-containing protein n=1 Tax=Halobacterium yunchengense TaxID=3108497 RepID=UPI0030083BC6
MIAATSSGHLAVTLFAVLASAAFARTALSHRENPTVLPVVGFATALLIGAVVHLAVVDLTPVRTALGVQYSPTATVGGYWLLVAFDVTAVAASCWFLFALQYTGSVDATSRGPLTAVGVLLAALGASNAALVSSGPTAGLHAADFNAVLGRATFLAAALALIGVFLLLETTARHKAFPTGQTALLVAAVTAVSTLPFTATTLRDPVVTPASVLAASVLSTAAVTRYRVFERLPAATVVGRDRIVDEMTEGVVVVDVDGRVRDLNPEAERLFDVDRATAVDRPLSATAPSLPAPDAVTAADRHTVDLDTGAVVTVAASNVTDPTGRTLGHLLVCRDVTDRTRRENRLAVLTQLVAGATREQMQAVIDATDAVDDGTRDPASAGADIHATATDAATLVARVRDVERALAGNTADHAETADLHDLLADLDAVNDSSATNTPLPSPVDPAVLSATLDTLAVGIDTADARVTVRKHATRDHALVELAPFDATTDQSVAHQALRIAELAADHADWTIRPTDGDTVTLRLPLAPETPRTEEETT